MSSKSKRQLYKPAPAAQTSPHLARQSLVQGRLSAGFKSTFSNQSGITHSSPKMQVNQGPHAKRSLNHSFNSVMASGGNSSNPSSSIAPMLRNSPVKARPSSSLSLSEPEDEDRTQEFIADKKTNSSAFEASVLAVDATHRHMSRADREVPIKATYMKSPAKVVCHSPKNKTRNGMHSPAANGNAGKISIAVESVPSFQLVPLKDNPNYSTDSPPQSEDGSLSTVAGSPVDPRSKAVETVVVQEKGNPRAYVSFLESGSCTDVSLLSKDSLSIDQSDVVVSPPNFDDTGFSSLGASKLDPGVEKVVRTKKKRTRVVSSKYMTSAMSRVGGNKSMNQPGEQLTRRITSASKISKVVNYKKGDEMSKSLLKDQTINDSIATNVNKPLHTSTPPDARLPSKDINNPSKFARKNEKSFKADASEFLGPANTTSKKNKSEIKAGKDSSSIKWERPGQVQTKKPEKNGEVNQLQHHMIFARLCQWRFLRLKQQHAFKRQEKQAQEWFYSMSKLNEQMRDRNHELQILLDKKKKEAEIDKQLELQLKVLRKLDAQTRQLYPEYENFYNGIDAIRHHLPHQDVIMPHNEDELLTALREFENNAEEVAYLLNHGESKIRSFSDEIHALAETTLAEKDEHERCTELLAAASTLAIQENSLKAEIIERKEAQCCPSV